MSRSNYLTTALASLVTFEELIYLLLDQDSPKVNLDGSPNKYRIFMTEFGQRKVFEIDDQIFVVKKQTQSSTKLSPLFLGTNGNDIWMYLLEKFYANFFGLYSSILTGLPYEVLYSFLDGEYRVYKLSKEKKDPIWTFLLEHYREQVKEKEPQTEEDKEYMNIDTHQRKKVILLQSYYPGDKIEKSPILFNQPEPQGKASEERNRSLGKLLSGVRNSNSYWDLLTNSVHMIVDLKSADVEKQTQEVPAEGKEVKKSNTLKNKEN